jgi:phospholipid transport system transporter-binding protein
VQNSDSAGLSCIVAILAESVRGGRPVKAVGVPPGMLALAKVCEVDHLLAS